METDPNAESRMKALEKALQDAESNAQKYALELEKLRQQYADDLYAERQLARQLHEERHELLRDYETLRVQKGGFGLKAMTLSGLMGFLGALVLLVLFLLLRPADAHTKQFAQYRDTHLFNFERSISQGQFEQVERELQYDADLRENKTIRPEIDFARKLVGAAKRRCQE